MLLLTSCWEVGGLPRQVGRDGVQQHVRRRKLPKVKGVGVETYATIRVNSPFQGPSVFSTKWAPQTFPGAMKRNKLDSLLEWLLSETIKAIKHVHLP